MTGTPSKSWRSPHPELGLSLRLVTALPSGRVDDRPDQRNRPDGESFILAFERHPSFLELRHGSVEVLHLETDRHRLRRCGGLGLAVRMQRDDRPRSFQFDPFVPISDRLTQLKVVSVELHGLFHILHHQGHFRGGKHTAPRTRSIPANVNLSSTAWRLPCDLEKLDPAPGGRKAEGSPRHPTRRWYA